MKRMIVQRKVAGVTVPVPVYQDEKTTTDLIEMVNERVREIENQSTRIDTHAFALLAALSFAAELHEARQQREREVRDILKTLRKITEALRRLTRDYNIR